MAVRVEIERHQLGISRRTLCDGIPRFNARALGRGGAVTRFPTPTPVVLEIFFRRFDGGSAAVRSWCRRFRVSRPSSASDQTIFTPSARQ